MSTLMIIFLILLLGYLLGSITVKGLNLGTSGVLIVALIFGHFGFELPEILQNVGLVIFVTSVGFIAGPRFFENFKKKAIAFVLLGIVIILTGAAVCVAAIKLFEIPVPLATGIMSGALTSTPGLAAAIEATGSDMASVGYGIAYPFGVVGVVLFVQLIPRFAKTAAGGEKKETNAVTEDTGTEQKIRSKQRKNLDEFGMLPFSLAIVLGLLIAAISVPLPGGASFSLGTSGAPLLAGLIIAHMNHIGPFSLMVPKKTLEVLREFGLALFLMGAGIKAGKGFVEILSQYGIALFFLGALITLLPMGIGYLLAKKAFAIETLSALGSICGGMTSTPALGTLMAHTHSEAVTVSYAATYPVALITVVLCCEFIPILFG